MRLKGFDSLKGALLCFAAVSILMSCSEGLEIESSLKSSGHGGGRLSMDTLGPLEKSSELKIGSGPYDSGIIFSHDSIKSRITVSLPLGINPFLRTSSGTLGGTQVQYRFAADEGGVWWCHVDLTKAEWQRLLERASAAEPIAWLTKSFPEMGPAKLLLGLQSQGLILKLENSMDPNAFVDFPIRWEVTDKVYGTYSAISKDESGPSGLQLLLNLE